MLITDFAIARQSFQCDQVPSHRARHAVEPKPRNP